MKRVIAPLTVIVLLFVLGSAFAAGTKDRVVAQVELGSVNIEDGLSMPDSGDGQNEPATVGGSKCRVNKTETDPPSTMMYFDYDSHAAKLVRPVYVTVEYFDEGFGAFMIQYDSADTSGPDRGAYKQGAAEVLLDSRKWRSVTFELPDARFDGRQEHGGDFRLVCKGRLAVRRVKIEMGDSESFNKQADVNRERIAASVGKQTPPQGMQVTFAGIDDAAGPDRSQVISDLKLLAPMFKALGVTSVQTAVPWKLVEPERGKWDWSYCDEIVSVLRRSDLRWAPMLVIGPGYASPDWFMSSNESAPAVCLEHNKASSVQSVWNPAMQGYADRFIGQFAGHYGGGAIESVMLGINGDVGEAVYPVTAPTTISAPAADYHTHPGFWCGDNYARDDLRKFLQTKYQTIEALNSAWKTNYDAFSAIVPAIPDPDQSARRRLDFVAWYRESMARWAASCLSICSKDLPSTQVYLCTGGDGRPAQGADFSAQCRAAADAGAGVELGNEGSGYAFDFSVTRLMASAGRLYKAPIVFQQAGDVTGAGLGSRVFNAASSQSRGMLSYYPTVLIQPGGIDAWSRCYRWLGLGKDVKKPAVAVLYPQTSLTLQWGGFYDKVMRLRDALDFDLVDESMIRDDALRRYKVLVLIEGKVLERDDIQRVRSWVESGGVVVACDFGGFATVEGDGEPYTSMFDSASGQPVSRRDHGSGAAYFVAKSWADAEGAAEGIARVLDSLSTRFGMNLVPDGRVDGVYVTQSTGKLLVLNSGQEPVTRELQTGIGRRKTVTLTAGTVTEVKE